ncbi:MAG: FAD-linked oxidase C-terminal domain-containing protein [Flaviflexus sp.]|nr:FAD-linked oxidase C-terminal domain-containing protein [Flaviflexus sp.]
MAESSKIAQALASRMSGEAEASARRRAEYSTDASNYRVVPQVVAFPADAEDIAAARDFAAREGLGLTMRGGGTSIAGNSIGPGIVLDTSRHMNKVLSVDPDARLARVQPGVILSDLQSLARPSGLRFGPDPSTQNRATLGGMIGNNACGPHAVAWGKTAENVSSLSVIDGRGRAFTAGSGLGPIPGLERLIDANLALIRTHMGRFSRQVSGYSLEHLLPERGRDLAKFLVGSEGTLALVTEAEVNLQPLPANPTLLVIGYADMIEAAGAVPTILAHHPLAIEGLDSRLVEVVRRAKGSVPELPRGGGWLMIEVDGESPAAARAAAEAIAADAGGLEHHIPATAAETAALWRIRADGAGLGGRTEGGAEAWPGWEDSAVPPERLGPYLADLMGLMSEHGLDGIPYGHFGDGCVHVRIDLPFDQPGGRARSRAFLEAAADLVVSYGGSLSGEHGDGRTRSELLERMYSPEILHLFAQIKQLADPDHVLNPGVIVEPDAIDSYLRRPAAAEIMAEGGFSFAEDGGNLTAALHRCTGVGNCRADRFGAGFFMCPSYRATRDEKDVTRGRMRVLEEVANGSLIDGWGAPEVMDSLDLCLSCKACSKDCPTGVDVARYKSEALYRAYRGKPRPLLHYLLGQLPRWTRLATALPPVAGLANRVMSLAPIRRTAFRLAGIDPARPMPPLLARRFSSWARERGLASRPRRRTKRVLLWADSFSETLADTGARDMVEVLEAAGYEVLLPAAKACCGLTWITTGQLDGAKAQLRQLLDVLAPAVRSGIPIVGVEPSCTAVLRSDLPDLLPEDSRASLVAANTFTLAELLLAPEPTGPGTLDLPDLSGTTIVAQPHCHHYSVMGWEADRKILEDTGARVITLSGCCGLAGNFGMEAEHAEISRTIANTELVPTLAEHPDAIFLADGFSCRTQASHVAGWGGVHLATLLARRTGALTLD